MMIDYEAILRADPNGVLATQDGKEVKTRVFQYLYSIGGKPYFCTGSQKPVYAQLMANPNTSFCTMASDCHSFLSVNGKAVFVEDMALKARALDENPGIKGIYKSPDNPAFKIFYIEVSDVDTFSHAEGPKNFKA